jgi:dATP/dGTP diphosphohydrolase
VNYACSYCRAPYRRKLTREELDSWLVWCPICGERRAPRKISTGDCPSTVREVEIPAAPPAPSTGKPSNPKDALGSTRAPLHMLPLVAQVAWSLAHMEGGAKYGLWNWCVAGVRASIYVAAAMRHLMKWFFGQTFDPKTGVHHLGYVMACCAILLDAEWREKLVDDRPPALPRIDELFAHAEAIMPGLMTLRHEDVKDWTINDNLEASE